MDKQLSKKWYAMAKKIVEEGAVLLKNDNNVLPLSNEKVAVFGYAQFAVANKSVTKTDLASALKANGCNIDEELYERYKAVGGAEKHYFTNNAVTLIDKELKFEEGEIQKIKDNGAETAVIVLYRNSGENEDIRVEEGGYLLSHLEIDFMKKVTAVFDKVVLVMSTVGNIDLGFLDEMNISSVIYTSKLFDYGTESLVRIMCGDVNPSGKLTFTMAKHLEDYPSTKYFGQHGGGLLQDYFEDIFVGYRYFDTFGKSDSVVFPFGFGLSYTSFDIKPVKFEIGEKITVGVNVTNTGEKEGKEIVQLYFAPPCLKDGAKLGRPQKELCGFEKTKLLAPNETQYIEIQIKPDDMVAYDDMGVLGTKSAWVMEKGTYKILAGDSSVNVQEVGKYEEKETRVIRKCISLDTALSERLTADGSIEKLPSENRRADFDASISANGKNVISSSLAKTPFNELKSGEESSITVFPGVGGKYALTFEGDTSKKIEDLIDITVKVDSAEFKNEVNADLKTDEKGIVYITLPMMLTKLIIKAKCDCPNVTALVFEKTDTTVVIEKDKKTVVGCPNYYECSYGIQIGGGNEKGAVVDYLTRFWGSGQNMTYRLDVKEAGTYDISFKYRYDGETEKVGNMMSMAVSNISQPLVGADFEKVCDENGNPVFAHTKPVAIELPAGIIYLKFVVEKIPFPDLADIVITKSASGTVACKKDGGEEVKSAKRGGCPQIESDDGKREGILLCDVYKNPELMKDFLEQLSNRELATIVSGTSLNKTNHANVGCNHPLFVRGVPAAQTADGSNGLYQPGIETVSYPSSILLATSFNRELMYEYGDCIAEECIECEVDMWLAPAINIFRNPCGGRNYTYASEDPYISGVFAVEQIKSVQSHGVVAMLKHYCANSTEYERLKSNSRVSERALREIYMKAFETAIKEANPWAIMSSYNHINNIKSCEDYQLITEIPRNEWHWDGAFVTDWWNDSNHVKELKAGHDLKMATGDINGVTAALDSGELTREQVYVSAERVLKMLMKIKYVKEFLEKDAQ